MPRFSRIPSSGSGLSESPSYQRIVVEPDIIVADTLLQDSSIENDILVVTKMPLPPLVCSSYDSVLERVFRLFTEGAIP